MRSAAKLEVVRGSITTAATLAHERTVPVVESLTSIVPSGGLQRGSTVAIHGAGATSFALALASQAIRQGSFLAVVAPPSFSLASCLDFDIPLRRVVQFTLPDDATNWAQAVAAVIEGFDVVMLADRHRVGTSACRQLIARNRERGSILLRVGGPAWSDAADLRFDVGSPQWSGLGQGHGHLRARQVSVRVAGRRHHGTERAHRVLLPAADGGVQPVPTEQPATVIPLEPAAIQPAAQPAAIQPAVAQSAMAQSFGRFAGADMDALLDVVDGPAPDGGESIDDAGAHDGADNVIDLNATA